jgi:hypothetical protein
MVNASVSWSWVPFTARSAALTSNVRSRRLKVKGCW